MNENTEMQENDMTLVDAALDEEVSLGEELSLAELLGFNVDESQDIADLIFAAKNGDPDSMGVLGQKFMKGQDVKKSIPKALYWLQESGDERAWNEIASFYEKEGDLDRAEEWYLKEIEKNGPYSFQGLNSLCLMYLRPEKLNVEEAEYYLVKSLEALENLPDRLKEKPGYLEYQNTLLYGAAGLLGFYYSKIDPVKAVFWLTEEQTKRIKEKPEDEQKISAKALAESYNQLFFLTDVSEELLKEAAEMIEPLAEKIGGQYLFGISEYYSNRRYETEKYFYWKEKAADKGDLAAQVQLSMAYLGESYIPEFKGISVDLDKCRYYLAKAKGNRKAEEKNPEKYAELMKICDQAEEWIIKEENKNEKHLTSKEAQQLIMTKPYSSEVLGIPQGYTHIDKMAFSGIEDKKALKSCREVRFPDSVRVIETQAFYETYNLERIKLPKSLRLLAAGAFDSCEYVMNAGFKLLFAPANKLLHELVIPGYTKLETVWKNDKNYTSLSGIFRIDKLVFEEGRTELSWNLFHDISIETAYIPDSVKKITFHKFDNYKFKVRRMSLPSYLKDEIPDLAAYKQAGCQFEFRN